MNNFSNSLAESINHISVKKFYIFLKGGCAKHSQLIILALFELLVSFLKINVSPKDKLKTKEMTYASVKSHQRQNIFMIL